MAWIINDGTPCDKLEYKGMEIVKSSTPTLFKKYLKEIVGNIIKGSDKESINSRIKEIRDEVMEKDVEEMGFARSANNISQYNLGDCRWKKGTPVHIKASIVYNHLLNSLKLTGKYPEINNGNKMSFIYLRDNPYETIGFVDEIPKEFGLHKFIDFDKQFDKGFEKPIQQFFDVLKWGQINYNHFDLLA